MTHLTHSAHTLRQLAEARAKHADRCHKTIAECIVCRDHFGVERRS